MENTFLPGTVRQRLADLMNFDYYDSEIITGHL